MISDKLQGVLTASVTPADDQGRLDLAAMARLVAYYAENGIRGVLLPSSTGESFALTVPERVALVTAAAKAGKGRISILANCSEHNIKDAIEDTKRMADAGADIVVCMPPQFLAYSQDELRDYFYAIADASALPMVVYNHMTRLPNRVEEKLVHQLAAHGNILGIKDTHNDPGRMLRLYATGVQKDFAILCGGDGVAGYCALLEMEMLNALSAVKPRLFTNLYHAGRAGDTLKVARYQLEVDKLMKLFTSLRDGLSSSTLFAQAIKVALSFKGLCGTHAVQLGYPLREQDVEKVRAIIDSVSEEIE